jgi:ribose transport system substrate-binding protein
MKSTITSFCLSAALALTFGAARAETVALVTINQQALFFNQINDGAKQAADKAGVKLVIFNANNQSAAQNSAIEDYIT